MRYILLCLVLLPMVFADKVLFDKQLSLTDDFTADGISFTIRASDKTLNAYISSPYLEVLVDEGDCVTKGYYSFCLEGFDWDDILAKVNLSVTKLSCANNLSCKLNVMEECSTDEECISLNCLHGTCTFLSYFCGDKYCDKNDCKADCKDVGKNTSLPTSSQKNVSATTTSNQSKNGEGGEDGNDVNESSTHTLLTRLEINETSALGTEKSNAGQAENGSLNQSVIPVTQNTTESTREKSIAWKKDLVIFGSILVIALLILLFIKRKKKANGPDPKDLPFEKA